mgnify:CR=1 FL=1
MLSIKNLKPGMKVRNQISKCIGVIRAGNDGKLMDCSRKGYVWVITRAKRGVTIGDRVYRQWRLRNLGEVKEE